MGLCLSKLSWDQLSVSYLATWAGNAQPSPFSSFAGKGLQRIDVLSAWTKYFGDG